MTLRILIQFLLLMLIELVLVANFFLVFRGIVIYGGHTFKCTAFLVLEKKYANNQVATSKQILETRAHKRPTRTATKKRASLAIDLSTDYLVTCVTFLAKGNPYLIVCVFFP